ncbi:hypothetical protein GOA89_14795 [Sinorhizobium meliloti]|nr:hypothetical protein [Sinorhizobium meliloti]MDW9847564.1 hypothetical protein [Sinorhizobium meliloti]MDX0144053.1 hypothetical protein [Sinorhizobium meliloti]MDX0150478.1 hypothetical protein [Sinorhizobium meliloti]MDX0169742.1 hypothetical protein [Sinorhizobium meliloti]
MDKKREALDLVWGIDEIGKLIGRNFQQTYHMIRSGRLPMVKKVGERYVASRQKLIAFFTEDAA